MLQQFDTLPFFVPIHEPDETSRAESRLVCRFVWCTFVSLFVRNRFIQEQFTKLALVSFHRRYFSLWASRCRTNVSWTRVNGYFIGKGLVYGAIVVVIVNFLRFSMDCWKIEKKYFFLFRKFFVLLDCSKSL